MAGNLELINKTDFSSVSTVNVDNVFSADYDVYKITLDTGGQYGLLRFLDSSGTLTTDSTYDTARLNLKINTTPSETRVTNTDVGIYAFSESSGSGAGGGNVLYVFNPFSSSYTFVTAQSVDINTSSAHRIAKAIGVYKNVQSLRGFSLQALASVTGTLVTYGVK
ncbi:MAG: hypothetical protein CL498_03555 [Actinobacteria bacterium]|nr:hypothetical protein [Actinomycetota bacterium]|tara:strand:- start:53 stop:547 length:495 start_codon:yes stop_codon:yes gene_type:complete